METPPPVTAKSLSAQDQALARALATENLRGVHKYSVLTTKTFGYSRPPAPILEMGRKMN